MQITKAILPALVAFTLGCQPETSPSDKKFYDIEGLANELIKENEEVNPSVKKFTKIGDRQNEETVGDIDWSKELDLLKQSDLNKAAYRLSYQEENTPGLIVYTLQAEENLPIKKVIIQLDGLGNPVQIEAKHHSENYLYSSEKDLKFSLKEGRLINYSISGWQELFVGGKKEFEVTGEIL